MVLAYYCAIYVCYVYEDLFGVLCIQLPKVHKINLLKCCSVLCDIHLSPLLIVPKKEEEINERIFELQLKSQLKVVDEKGF